MMRSEDADGIVNVIDASNRRIVNLGELWTHRELFYFFTWRDIKIKYKQTVLGFLWAILQPLFMMLIFSLFFGRFVKTEVSIPYPVFAFSGLLIWNIFSLGLASASNSMVNNSLIIKKIYFPRLIIPVSSVLVSLFDFLMAFVLFIPILIYYQQPVTVSALWAWPLAILIGAVATLGLGCFLAALNVKYRDFRYVIPFMIQILFFVSPVIYPLTALTNPAILYLLSFSPVYAAIELFRMPITGVAPDAMLMTISVCSCFAFLAIGLTYFWKTENFFADLA